MKSLHKKISAVVLIAVLGAPVLSQGFVAHANLNIRKVNVSSYDEFKNYNAVVGYEKYYYYDSLYLGSSREFKDVPKGVPLKIYSDRVAFVKGLKKGDLKIYIRKDQPIIIKVGKSYFKLFFNFSDYQRQRFMMEECAKEYGFKIICSNRIDYWSGLSEMDSRIMNIFEHSNVELMWELLKEPKYIFRDVQQFASDLELGKFKIPKGYHRYRIGIYDYVLYKK